MPISSSTSSTPWRLTWRRRACCQRWRRLLLRASCSPHQLILRGRPERRAAPGGALRSPRVPGDLQCFVWARIHQRKKKKKRKTTKNYSLGSFRFIWIGELCMFVFIQSVNFWLWCFQVELVNYCTVHISIIDNLYLFTLLNKMLVSCTFLPVHRISSIYLLMCVLYFVVFLFVCFNALLNSVTHWIVTPAAPSSPNLSFNFFVVIVSIYTKMVLYFTFYYILMLCLYVFYSDWIHLNNFAICHMFICVSLSSVCCHWSFQNLSCLSKSLTLYYNVLSCR